MPFRSSPSKPVRSGLATTHDTDRHGIVTPGAGLMNPTTTSPRRFHLFTHRPGGNQCGVGKTVVSSSIIDRPVRSLNAGGAEAPGI